MKCIHAELQNSVVFNATEVLGFTTLNESKIIGIELTWMPGDGLYVKSPKLKGRKRVGFVPAANVKCLEFSDEPEVRGKNPKELKAV